MAKYDLTADELRKHIHYDPESGAFTRLTGPRIGYMPRPERCRGGYLVIEINGEMYFGHQLAWLYVYGKFPDKRIDHIDRDRSNTRISNLRDITQSANMQNQIAKKGYRRVGNKYQARLHSFGVYESIGWFNTADEARAAYLAAKEQLIALGDGFGNQHEQDGDNP